MEGSRREATSLSLAEILVHLGAYIAIQQREYQEAFDYIAAFLHHPQAAQLDDVYWSLLSGSQFFCLLHLDRQEQALQLATRMLQAERPSDAYLSALTLLNYVSMYCRAQKENASVPEPLAALLYDVMERPIRKNLKTPPLPIQHGALLAWLDAMLDETREREERARQKRIQRKTARAEAAPSSDTTEGER